MESPINRLQQHYQNVTDNYDRFYHLLFEEGRKAIAVFIAGKIGDDRSQVVVDLGGGTGETIGRLKRMLRFSHQYLLVEPFESMSVKAAHRGIRPDQVLTMTAEQFVAFDKYENTIDVLLCQEMIHLVERFEAFAAGARRVLKLGGRLIIITRPLDVEFPFGKHAKRRWKEGYQLSPAKMTETLKQLGFAVEVDLFVFPIEITKELWMEIVEKTPLFSHNVALSSRERQQDLREMQALGSRLKFNDNVIAITAIK